MYIALPLHYHIKQFNKLLLTEMHINIRVTTIEVITKYALS